MKRVIDLCVSSAGIVILAPIFLVIGVAVLASSPGPVLFRQQRIGRNGTPFLILKFRTMRAGTFGPAITARGDARITPVGAFLRKWKLDELPQLFNVLCGEMSLVGPRPEVPKYVALYSESQKRILALKPGITDMASIQFRNEEELLAAAPDPERWYIDWCMPRKIQLNLEYAARASVTSDLRVIWLTLRTVFRLPPPGVKSSSP